MSLVETYLSDVLQAWEQPEAEQVGEGEANNRGAVGVNVVAVDVRAGQVAQQAFDHGCDFGGGAAL